MTLDRLMSRSRRSLGTTRLERAATILEEDEASLRLTPLTVWKTNLDLSLFCTLYIVSIFVFIVEGKKEMEKERAREERGERETERERRGKRGEKEMRERRRERERGDYKSERGSRERQRKERERGKRERDGEDRYKNGEREREKTKMKEEREERDEGEGEKGREQRAERAERDLCIRELLFCTPITFPHCLACIYEKMLDFEKCEKSLPDTQK